MTISAFDLDRLESELTAVTEQRDRLAEALETVLEEVGGDHMACKAEIKQALAAVKGGSDE